MSKLLPWQIEQIELYATKGWSGLKVARKLELKPATVNYRMLRLGYDPWPKHGKGNAHQRGAFSPAEDARMLELGQTLPIHRVAKEMKRAITSVRIRMMTLEVRAEKACA